MLVGEDPRFPLGRRGDRPLKVAMDKATGRRIAGDIPGAVWVKGNLTLSWDALPVAQRLFSIDAPMPEPVIDLPGLEEYRACFAERLRKYQKVMLQFLVLRSYAINADPMRCLWSGTQLTVRLAKRTVQVMTLRELVWRFRELQYRFGEGKVELLSMEPGGEVHWNPVTAVHVSGRKRCKSVRLASGQELIATPEHKVMALAAEVRWANNPTMVPLGQLKVGDALLITDGRKGQHVGWTVANDIVSIRDAGELETFDLTMTNPLNNYVANGIVVSNSGKTPTTLAAACIIGTKKTLIVCPSIAKLVWATELVKWMKQPSLILYGRSGEEAKEFCVRCNGTGHDLKGKYCPDCKSKNGQSYGYRIYHTRAEVLEAIKRSRFVIANYDILTPQMQRSDAGVRSERDDLPGWYAVLAEVGFDLCIIDEAHILRGRSKGNRVGESRRDKLKVVCQFIERVWALTGTPIFGRVADMWAMLDVITHGLFGCPGWDYDRRYANGHKGEYGWENDGMTHPDELKSRLDAFLLKRDRREILPELPPKTRQIIRIDAGKADFKKPPKGTGSGGIHGALRVTANIKEDIVVEAVSNEAAEGGKCVVFTYLRDNAQAMYAAFEKAREKDPRLKLRNLRVWCVTGDVSTDARFKQAQAFREWEGAAIFIATIDSVPVAISLKGAQSVHFADLTFDPATLLQAEDRPYEMGTTGLAIIYYVVEKTIDEHVIELVLPKMEMLENILAESAASDFSHAFSSKQTPEQIAEEIWARMEANVI